MEPKMASKTLLITNDDLTFKQIEVFRSSGQKIRLADDVKEKIQISRTVVEDILQSDQSVYGVNTGFGKFSEVRISNENVEELQKRLVYSHAAGIGRPINQDIVRLIMLLKIKSLSLGYSGCRLQIVNMLIKMLNNNIIPVIPEKGSVGASGDLAPLAHMALVMMGKGSAFIRDKTVKNTIQWLEVNGKEVLDKYKMKPISLKAKDGLAILNGTQVSTALGIWAYLKGINLIKVADIVGAITVEALLGTLTPFDARIHKLRSHPGQKAVAANIRKILAGSPIVSSHKYDDDRVQDAYSLRCIPQVHGAIRDALGYVEKVLLTEMNSLTDNPLILPEKKNVISGGNFHAAPIGYACDLMGIVLTDLSSISERRIEHMQDPNVSLLPGFLTRSGGLNSGFMIAHVTAAALSSENKVLSHPASVDSIPTSANKEDHVSMATYAARKALEISENLEDVLAIELISACQALDLRAPLTPSESTGAALEIVRSHIPFWKNDREIYKDMIQAKKLIESGALVSRVEKICGPLQ
jgi:histidine ammonia-lyase